MISQFLLSFLFIISVLVFIGVVGLCILILTED